MTWQRMGRTGCRAWDRSDCLQHSGVRERVVFHERAYSNIDCRLRAGNEEKQRRAMRRQAGDGRRSAMDADNTLKHH